MATATELLQVPIAGMTCEHCVRTVSQALTPCREWNHQG